MKLASLSVLFGSLAAGEVISQDTPIDKVVDLLGGLAKTIENDGKEEQASYDKYACWVENTLQRKASDISKAKDLIAELSESIKKLKGQIGSHTAEIAQLEKDLAQNKEAQEDATGLRNKENGEYAEERIEAEQCIGALEMAIKVLTGAGTKKAGFLQQLQKSQLETVAASLRRAMQHSRALSHLSEAQLADASRFLQDPEHYSAESKFGVSLLQTEQNPFGDYAPQSTQIQGILQGMYDAFTSDLEKDNAHEADKQKSYQELIATKQQEMATLGATLKKSESDMASKTKAVADAIQLRDDTTTQLKADEQFFAETTHAAEEKAAEWSTRTRLRVEELAGIQGAMQILSGGEKTFKSATTTLLQLKSVRRHQSNHEVFYGHLKMLAAKHQSKNLARLALVLKTGGHFDAVMEEIDKMMEILRKEEQDDIAHRDRCENSQNANSNALDDVNKAIKDSNAKLGRLDAQEDQLTQDLDAVKDDIDDTKKKMAELLDLRNGDHADFVKALKDDMDAVDLIKAALVRLTKYYKENKVAVSMLQQPQYSNDLDKAPETSFSGGGHHQGEATGIVAILDMIKEDLQKEIKEGRADEAKAQAEYEKQNGSLQSTLDAQTASKVGLETDLAAVREDSSAASQKKQEQLDDKKSEKGMAQALKTDCAWVKSHFDKRRQKRKNEMQGLVDAKSFLSGAA